MNKLIAVVVLVVMCTFVGVALCGHALGRPDRGFIARRKSNGRGG